MTDDPQDWTEDDRAAAQLEPEQPAGPVRFYVHIAEQLIATTDFRLPEGWTILKRTGTLTWIEATNAPEHIRGRIVAPTLERRWALDGGHDRVTVASWDTSADDAADRLEAERLAADVCIRRGPGGETCAQHYDHTGHCDWWVNLSADERGDWVKVARANVHDAYTAEARLCDEVGIVSDEPVASGSPGTVFDPNLTYRRLLNNLRRHTGLPPYTGPGFRCTGSAHLAGEHFRCTNPIHSRQRAQAAYNAVTAVPDGR